MNETLSKLKIDQIERQKIATDLPKVRDPLKYIDENFLHPTMDPIYCARTVTVQTVLHIKLGALNRKLKLIALLLDLNFRNTPKIING